MAVDLFGRGVGDSPVVRPIPSDSAVTFCKVGRNRSCRADHLIGNGLQRSWNPHDQLDRDSRCFKGFVSAMRLVFVAALDMVTSGSFMPFQSLWAADVKGAPHPACP